MTKDTVQDIEIIVNCMGNVNGKGFQNFMLAVDSADELARNGDDEGQKMGREILNRVRQFSDMIVLANSFYTDGPGKDM